MPLRESVLQQIDPTPIFYFTRCASLYHPLRTRAMSGRLERPFIEWTAHDSNAVPVPRYSPGDCDQCRGLTTRTVVGRVADSFALTAQVRLSQVDECQLSHEPTSFQNPKHSHSPCKPISRVMAFGGALDAVRYATVPRMVSFAYIDIESGNHRNPALAGP